MKIFVLAVINILLVVDFAVCQRENNGNSGLFSTDYLRKYGYMPTDDHNTGSLLSHDVLTNAVKQFQKMAGIPVTGIVDAATRRMMLQPRCGVPDHFDERNAGRFRRYALHGSKWSKVDLTYKISQFSNTLSRTDTLREITRAFDAWSKVTPLKFERKDSGVVDIEIKFARSWHGDNNPFDGKGQTLAHAFFPQYGGDAHFDDDEPWTVDVSDGVNFFQVAVHEFGHSLGLAHSDVYSALMAPFYKGYQKEFSLGTDDVEAVQALYGTPSSRRRPTPTPTPKPTTSTPRPRPRVTQRPPRRQTPRPRPTQRPQRPPPRRRPYVPRRPQSTRTPVLGIPEICKESSLDAITKTKDGITYIFKDKYYYRLNKYGIESGYPKKISHDWKGVHGPVDAALTWENGYTYIFRRNYYWKFENRRLIYGPKRISYGFHGVPGDLDAAMVWGGNGKTYFFKGKNYYRYSGRRIDPGYPRPISKWRGLPKGIQGAFKWENGRTYFFTGKNYYRYNDQLFSVDATYPRPIATWWLGCPHQGSLTDVRNPYMKTSSIREGEDRNSDIQTIYIEDEGDEATLPNKENSSGNTRASFLSIVFIVFISLINFIV